MKNQQTVKKKKRVLIYGDYNCTTGFSTVVTNIFQQVSNYFGTEVEFDIVAINWFGDRMPDDFEFNTDEAADFKNVDEMVDGEEKLIWKRIRKVERPGVSVYSAYHFDGKDDLFGRNGMLSLLNSIDYSLLFMIQDLGIVSPIFEVIKHIKSQKKQAQRKQFKVLYYFPLDCGVMRTWFKDIDVVDRLIAYTEFGKKSAKAVFPDLKMSVILHGVDQQCFEPLPYQNIYEFREAFFAENHSKTIISNINRNQHRKDIPSTILSFKEYHERYNQNSFLYLHMNPVDLYSGWNLHLIMEQLGLRHGEHYMYTPDELIENPPPPGFVNCLYNASDIVLSTTTGEGFGLTILEAMQAGAAVMAPYHTSIMEINGYNESPFRLWPLQADLDYCDRFDHMLRKQVDPYEVAYQMNELLSNPVTVANIREAGHEYAKQLNWKSIGGKWIDEFKKLL